MVRCVVNGTRRFLRRGGTRPPSICIERHVEICYALGEEQDARQPFGILQDEAGFLLQRVLAHEGDPVGVHPGESMEALVLLPDAPQGLQASEYVSRVIGSKVRADKSAAFALYYVRSKCEHVHRTGFLQFRVYPLKCGRLEPVVAVHVKYVFP